jgi:hypothetical protein
MIDWLIVGIYGTFLIICAIAYFLSDFVFIGLGYIDRIIQENPKHFSNNKVNDIDNKVSKVA